MLAEVYLGDILFDTHDDSEHLALIEKMIKPFTQDMLARARFGENRALIVGDRNGWAIDFPRQPVSEESVRMVQGSMPIHRIFDDYRDFISLMEGMLQIEAVNRFDTRRALAHPFISRK